MAPNEASAESGRSDSPEEGGSRLDRFLGTSEGDDSRYLLYLIVVALAG